MYPDFYYYKVDLMEHQRMFEDEPDFITWVHYLHYLTVKEVQENERR